MISFISRSVSIAVAASLATAPAITTAQEVMHQGPKLSDSATLPKTVEQEAIASVEAETGEIAGIRIGNSAYFIAYIKAATNCGSGGCRAQIWKRDGDQYVRQQSLPVGYLPITVLPDIDHGMPRLGVSVYDTNSNQMMVLPIAFDGQDYALSDWDQLLSERSGEVVLTSEMLKKF